MKNQTIQQRQQEEQPLVSVKEAQQHTPLDQEIRSAIPTDAAAYHLNRRDQTLRMWACLDCGPIRPLRINGRLAWPVAAIRELLKRGQ